MALCIILINEFSQVTFTKYSFHKQSRASLFLYVKFFLSSFMVDFNINQSLYGPHFTLLLKLFLIGAIHRTLPHVSRYVLLNISDGFGNLARIGLYLQ
jgi:hypothetical protein